MSVIVFSVDRDSLIFHLVVRHCSFVQIFVKDNLSNFLMWFMSSNIYLAYSELGVCNKNLLQLLFKLNSNLVWKQTAENSLENPLKVWNNWVWLIAAHYSRLLGWWALDPSLNS